MIVLERISTVPVFDNYNHTTQTDSNYTMKQK